MRTIDSAARRARLIAGVLCLGSALSMLVACSSEPRSVRDVDIPVVRDIPSALYGTIGAETTIGGLRPELISGYGLVVGLNGTGGDELPAAIRSTMERMLAQRGVTVGGPFDRGPLAGKSPSQVLRDPNIAVVVVQAAIAPGTPIGNRFDVLVRALPGTGTTSLEGGQLWTADLRLGPPTPFEGIRARQLAEARGPVFINPFEEPTASGRLGPRRLVGRVLGGGEVTQVLRLNMQLDNPSHSRARAIVSAVNSRFPPGRGDDGPTAHGRDNVSIGISIPARYRDEPGEFLQLLTHTDIDQSYPEERSRRYAEAMKREPQLASELGWRLQAIGPASIPFLVPLYDSDQLRPRMAALGTGARLGDPRTRPHLIALAEEGPIAIRSEAMGLMKRLPAHPSMNRTLVRLLEEPELGIRVAAYEALSAMNDPVLSSQLVGRDPELPLFRLDHVPIGDPLIYVTQQVEPRIVLFGDLGMEISPDEVVSAWSDRFMLTSVRGETLPRVWYEDHRTGERTIHSIRPALDELVRFAAHRQSPEAPQPGLGLSYAETVGLLYEIQRQGGVPAAFATEQDRLMSQLLDASEGLALADRPETESDRADAVWSERSGLRLPGQVDPSESSDGPTIVPIERDEKD